jgi:hypothetical protein
VIEKLIPAMWIGTQSCVVAEDQQQGDRHRQVDRDAEQDLPLG